VNKPWTEEDIELLKDMKNQGLTNTEIAAELKRTRDSVGRKLTSIKVPETDFRALSEHWKKKATELEHALNEARQSKTAVDILCEQVQELAPKSYQPAPFSAHKRPDKKKSSPQSAVLLFSDTHIGAVVKPEQTLGLGGYDFEIFLRRLRRTENSVFSILQDHTTTQVPEIVIPMIGDMIDGGLAHSAECGQVNTILSQFYSGGHAIAQFFRNLSTLAPLRIYGCVGNHPRWQNQKKMPTKNRASNMDMLLYLYIQALTRDIPTIKWHLDSQPFASFEVQGHQFMCLHGDNLRGGDKMLGIPNHSMGRMVSTTTQLFTRAGRETPSYYCVGHLHRPISIPHARGEIIVNGAFPGIDGYALSEYFNSSHPSQKLFLMHPKYGRAATYDLRLDLGDGTPHGYQLPDQFPCQ
jgi:hypothetical protein